MTNQPPWAVDDPIGVHHASRRVRWDQRAMLGLAVYYLVLLHVLLRLVKHDDAGGLGDVLLLAATAAMLLLIRSRAVFTIIASVIGLLLLAALCAFPSLAPAGLPLLLAQIRLPHRWMRAGVPVLLAGTAAGMSLLGWVFTLWP